MNEAISRRYIVYSLLAHALAIVASFLSGFQPVYGATIVIRDQYAPSDVGSGGWSQAFPSRQIAQTFPVTLDGFLDHVELYINKQSNQQGNMFWNIRPTVNGVPAQSTSLASGSMPIASLPQYWDRNPITLDLSNQPVRVRPGDLLAITIASNGGGAYWLSHSAGNPGQKFERFGTVVWQPDTFFPGRAHAFATYVRLVPEPTSAVIALLAATTLAKRGRRLYKSFA